MGTTRTDQRGRGGLAAALACIMALALAGWQPAGAQAAPGAQSSRADAVASSAADDEAAAGPEDGAAVLENARLAAASADDAETLIDTAGNVFSASRLDGSDNGESTGALELTVSSDNDFLWAGYALELNDSDVAGDVLAAGRNVTLRDTTADGSVRVAAQGITLANASVGRNATLAAQTIYLNDDTTVGGAAYLAAASVKFAGTADALFVASGTATISGTVNGDAYVYADDVRVEEGAVVTGTLYVEGANEPSVAGSAQLGRLDVKLTGTDAAASGDSLSVTDIVASCAWGAAFAGVGALLLALVLPGATCGGARMLRTRLGSVVLSGILGTLLSLPAVLALVMLVLSAQMGVALLASLSVVALVSAPLVGAALMGALFPKMNRFGAALLGGVIWGALECTPYAGPVVAAIGLMLAVGLAIQAVWLQLRRWQGVRAGGETASDGSSPASGTLPGAAAEGAATQAATPQAAVPAPQAATPGTPSAPAGTQRPADDGRPVPPPAS